MDEGYDGYRMMLRDLFPEHDKKRVFVVNGSPSSGKTTFVKSKIRQGDIALDFDKLTAGNFIHPMHRSAADFALMQNRISCVNVICSQLLPAVFAGIGE